MRRIVRQARIPVFALALFTGCFLTGNDVIIDEEVPAVVETLAMPDTVRAGEPIQVEIAGYWGTSSAYRRERIEQEKAGRTWTIRPIARHRVVEGEGYLTAPANFEQTIAISADSGWTYVVVVSRNPPLVDSTFVLQ